MTDRIIPEIPGGCDVLRAALTLIRHGIYVIPVEPDTKRPAKFLHRQWQHKSSADTEQVVEWFTGTPYLLGIHVGRSGLVVFDVDEYDLLPDELVTEFTSNPGPWQSTRESGLRGHRIYLQPPGRNLGNSLGELRRMDKSKWGEIRGANGIIVFDPSHHTVPGGRYKLMVHGKIPVLSPEISGLLPDINEEEANSEVASAETVKAFLAEHTGKENPWMAESIVDFFGRESNSGSRHEAAVRAMCWAMREARMGNFPAREISLRIYRMFSDMLSVSPDRFARPEFMGILAYAVAQAGLIDVEARKAEQEERIRARDEKNGWAKASAPPAVEAPGVVVLEDPYDPKGTPPTIIDTVDRAGDPDVEVAGYFDTGYRDKEGRLRVNVADRSGALPYLRSQLGSGPLSGLFLRGRMLVHTPLIGEAGYVAPKLEGASDGPAQVRAVSTDGLVAMFDTKYNIGRVEENKKTGNKQWRRVLFPNDLAKRCLGSAEIGEASNLRTLHGVSHTPVVRADGSIMDEPGYDKATKLLFLPTDGLSRLNVPEHPSATEIIAARETISYPISQFPWVNDNGDDMANWVGAAFTPLLRSIVPPPYQFLVIEAPSPGSGKGYLLGILDAIHGVALRPGMPTKDEEWSKVIMTMLSGTTAPIIAFDNVRGTVHSAVLEGLLTTAKVSDRMLGKNTEYLEMPNDRLWAMTGNNAQIGGDLARRTLRVTIDPRQPNPETRTGFRCQPVSWARTHRVEYIRAMLTIIRGWVAAGRPVPALSRSDDYAHWIQTVRGIMEYGGFAGTFANSEARRERSTEDEEWGAFLAAIVDAFGTGTSFTAKELYAQIEGNALGKPLGVPISAEMLPGDLAEKFGSWNESSRFVKSLGHWLRNRVGRYVGDLKVADLGKGTTGQRKNVSIFALERSAESSSS